MLSTAAEKSLPFELFFTGLILWLTQLLAHPELLQLQLVIVTITLTISWTGIKQRSDFRERCVSLVQTDQFVTQDESLLLRCSRPAFFLLSCSPASPSAATLSLDVPSSRASLWLSRWCLDLCPSDLESDDSEAKSSPAAEFITTMQ